ncbi:hypothetical protein Tco_0707180 [Tanacetum coccineum]|uniref:Uncharacterized protein n=1 Tax=Tanacetum coccineum TaxID=301880 RepID=A0ABQ4Y9H6_9ASTR
MMFISIAAPGSSNILASYAIDEIAEFSGETEVPKFMKFFILQEISEARRYASVLYDEALTVRTCLAQVNAMISEIEAMDDQEDVFDSLMSLRDSRSITNDKLLGLNDMIAEAEEEISSKEGHVKIMDATINFEYGSGMMGCLLTKDCPMRCSLRSVKGLFRIVVVGFATQRHFLYIVSKKCGFGYIEGPVYRPWLEQSVDRFDFENLQIRKLQLAESFPDVFNYHSDKKINNGMVTDVRSISEDYRIASEINRVVREVNNVVVEKDQFLEELHSLGVRPVPAKMVKFLKEIQMKDRETMSKLQILKREMKLNARKKGEGGVWSSAFAGLMCDLCFSLRISLSKKRRLIAELEALGERGDAIRSLDHMRDIVARDSCTLGVLEQLLARTHVGMRLKDGYVADMEERSRLS